MARITLRQAAAWCGGSVAAEFENIVFQGANIDSRLIEEGKCQGYVVPDDLTPELFLDIFNDMKDEGD